MTNKKLKRKIAVALSVAIATTMVTTAIPVEFEEMVAEAAVAATIKMTMKSEKIEVTDEMREKMYKSAGEENVDSEPFTETDGQLIKLTLNLDTPNSGIEAAEFCIAYNAEKSVPVAFFDKNGNSFREVKKYYKYDDIDLTRIHNFRSDREDKDGKKYVNITGITINPIIETGLMGIFYFWIPSTSIGTADFELYNYKFGNENGSAELQETSTIYSYDTGREAATVIFDANGGFFGEETTIEKTVAKDSEVKIENPTFDGREFLGWSEDRKGESGIKETVTAKDGVIYYAIWTKPDLPSTVTASIEGILEFDSTINAKSEGKPQDAGEVSYQWYRSNEQNGLGKIKIEGATGASYKIVAEDVGKYLNVEVSYSEYRGSASAFTEVVQKAKQSAPIITAEDCTKTADQITVKQLENALYSINGENFTENNVFTGLEPKKEYNISVKYAATEIYLESEVTTISVTTTKAIPIVKDNITANCVYGTTLAAIKPIGEMVYNGKAVEGTFEWKEENANGILPKTGEKYKAIFRPKDTEIYEETEVETEISCEAKKITVKAISASAIYGQALPSFDFEVDENDFVGSDTKKDLALTLQTNAPQKPDAGQYTITKKECGNVNYDVTVEPNVLTIEKAKPIIQITNTKEIQGSVTGAKAVITPESADAQAVIEYKAGKADTWTEKIPTEVGTYTVRAYLPEEKAGKNLVAIPSGNAITAEYHIEKKASSDNEEDNKKPDGDNTGGNGNTGSNVGGNGSSGIGGGSSNGGSSSGGSVVTPPVDNQPSKEDQNTDPSKDKDTINSPSDDTDKKDDTGKDNNTSSDNKQDNEKDDNKQENTTSKKKNKKPTKKKKVKLNKKKASVKVGKTIKLKVLNTKKKITWSSNKPKIVKVSKKGKVTALRPGKAVIKAKIKNGKTLKFKITVKKASKNKK